MDVPQLRCHVADADRERETMSYFVAGTLCGILGILTYYWGTPYFCGGQNPHMTGIFSVGCGIILLAIALHDLSTKAHQRRRLPKR